MLTPSGPRLLEYNFRFGDPECQALLPRLMTDLGQLLQGGAAGVLGHMDLRWYPEHVMTVVMAARGYPGDYNRGSRIRGLEVAAEIEGITIFHAGTRIEPRPGVRERRACAQRHRLRRHAGRGPRARLRRDRSDRLARRLLPPRHRLARSGRQGVAGSEERILPGHSGRDLRLSGYP